MQTICSGQKSNNAAGRGGAAAACLVILELVLVGSGGGVDVERQDIGGGVLVGDAAALAALHAVLHAEAECGGGRRRPGRPQPLPGRALGARHDLKQVLKILHRILCAPKMACCSDDVDAQMGCLLVHCLARGA